MGFGSELVPPGIQPLGRVCQGVLPSFLHDSPENDSLWLPFGEESLDNNMQGTRRGQGL